MSLTSYRAAPPRVNTRLCTIRSVWAAARRAKPRSSGMCKEKIEFVAIIRPGDDLLSRVLRRSTIGAGAFHGRVRHGNGWGRPAIVTRSENSNVRSWFWFGFVLTPYAPSRCYGAGCGRRAAQAATAGRPCGAYAPYLFSMHSQQGKRDRSRQASQARPFTRKSARRQSSGALSGG